MFFLKSPVESPFDQISVFVSAWLIIDGHARETLKTKFAGCPIRCLVWFDYMTVQDSILF